MRGTLNPIRSRMQMRMPQPMSNMPVIDPGMMDEDMVRSGPYDMGNAGIDMPPGQGDLGMERMYPELEPGQAQAMPVHDIGQAQKFYRGLGKTMPQPMQNITSAYEGAPEGPLRSKMHAAQHQMMVGDQKGVLASKRMELAAKKQQLEGVLMSIKRGETMDSDGKLFRQIQAGIGQIDGILSQIPMDPMAGR